MERWRVGLAMRNYRIRLENEPLSFFPFLIHKFVYLWYGTQTGDFYKQLLLGFSSLLIIPVAVLQIWLWKNGRPYLTSTLSVLLLYFVGLHLVTAPEFRYMLPIFPFLIFAASHQYLGWIRSARAGRLAPNGAARETLTACSDWNVLNAR